MLHLVLEQEAKVSDSEDLALQVRVDKELVRARPDLESVVQAIKRMEETESVLEELDRGLVVAASSTSLEMESEPEDLAQVKEERV